MFQSELNGRECEGTIAVLSRMRHSRNQTWNRQVFYIVTESAE